MIIWLNGPFGAGKTTTVLELQKALPAAVVFDPEEIGFMLRHALGGALPDGDFQELGPWRRLTIAAIKEVSDYFESDVIVPQSVLVERYWDELRSGLAAAGLDCRSVTLHTAKEELERRITNDEFTTGAREWRLNHIDSYETATPWLRATTVVIDTTDITPEHVAAKVVQAVTP
ncbi:AAA family ATPase [Salinibacterium sp. NK8237]|uniref:AAA family ATPase n=1 Tax=Salinibacterium sp. NK8237 TaxID=2792038 RepID=UPI0018CF7750|nr:AAA family ATPase [Salinibacterium sp. NK8237]MBH0128827.1 AAA family ATPase [Salinibacterium sp. NK8237]